MSRPLNVCGFRASDGGTDDFAVSVALNGLLTPENADAVDGGVYHYRAESDDSTQWEIGVGTYTADGETLTRSPIKSSNDNELVNFTNPPMVRIVALADDLGMQYFTDEQNTSAPNATIKFVGLKFVATAPYDGGFDFKGYDSDSGTGGAFSLQIPDGTAVGGNKRGTGAIDLSIRRSGASQVASGDDSIRIGNRGIAAGARSTAIGDRAGTSEADSIAIGTEAFNDTGNSGVSLGNLAYTFGDYATSIGPFSAASADGAVAVGNSAYVNDIFGIAIGTSAESYKEAGISIGSTSRAYSFGSIALGYSAIAGISGDDETSLMIAIGSGAEAAGIGSVSIGAGSSAGGNYSTSVGNDSNTPSDLSVAVGYASFTNGEGATAVGIDTSAGAENVQVFGRGGAGFLHGQIVLSNGVHQSNKLLLMVETSDATPTPLTSNNGGEASTDNQINASSDIFAIMANGYVIAHSGVDMKAWKIEVFANKPDDPAHIEIVGTPVITVIAASAGAAVWDIDVSADTSNESIAIIATGAAATAISWVADIDYFTAL
jgi:hypothetical protein